MEIVLEGRSNLDILWTGSFLYAPYSFLLISTKFEMGGEWCSSVVMLLYRTVWVRGGMVQLCYSYFTEFSGPQMALADWLDAISKGPKLSISRAQPPPTCPCILSSRIKNITHGAVKIIGA